GMARAPVSGSGLWPACTALVSKPYWFSMVMVMSFVSWSANGCSADLGGSRVLSETGQDI
ncbi:MAG: hypothetical protein WCE80_03635, partial [Acidimicrobiia bacterium]